MRDEDALRSADTGLRVVRGSALRGLAYLAGVVLVAGGSVLLLRHLGVVDFGRYVTVMALIGIVSGVTDAGLTSIGNRELALLPPGEERRALLADLVTLRLLITPLGVLAATVFAVVAGYTDAMIYGTLLAGGGLVLVNTQATLMLPLAVELRNARLATAELLKQVVTVGGMAVLVVAGASLLPFFTLQIVVGLVVLAATPLIVGRDWWQRPGRDRRRLRRLLLEALPLATALALNVVYFRALVIIASLVLTAEETGFVATSFRIFEVLLGIPVIAMGVALPVLSAAAQDGAGRMAYVLQRMTEVGLAAATLLAVLTILLAEPVIELLGGSEYQPAAPVLRIQALALIGLFLSTAWQFGLISIRGQRDVAVANAVALTAVIALGAVMLPLFGAEGAGVAAAAVEALLAAILWTMLHRRGVAPSLGFAWKVALAAGLGLAPLLVPGMPELVAAALAALLFAAVAWVTGLVPPEVVDGFRRKARAG